MRIIKHANRSYWLTGNKPYPILKVYINGGYLKWKDNYKSYKEQYSEIFIYTPTNKDADEITDFLCSQKYEVTKHPGKNVRPRTDPMLLENTFTKSYSAYVMIAVKRLPKIIKEIQEFAKRTNRKILYDLDNQKFIVA